MFCQMITEEYRKAVSPHLQKLNELPSQLRHHLDCILERDRRIDELETETRKEFLDFYNESHGYKRKKRLKKIRGIREKLKKGKRLADEKVAISQTIYELVDSKIIELDETLFALENTSRKICYKDSLCESSIPTVDVATTIRSINHNQSGTKQSKTIPSRRKGASLRAAYRNGVKRRKSFNSCNSSIFSGSDKRPDISDIPPGAALTLALTNNPEDVIDMPVDPDEPVYCFCRQVSHGQMVACDNSECSIEWFHFGCVGVVVAPKGPWFCPNCTGSRHTFNSDVLFAQ